RRRRRTSPRSRRHPSSALRPTDAELDLPSLVRRFRLERHRLEQQRPDLRHGRTQRDRDDVALRAPFGGEIHLDGRELLDLAGLPPLDDRADGILAPYARAEEPKMHLLPDDDAELATLEVGARPLLHPERRDAERGDGRL